MSQNWAYCFLFVKNTGKNYTSNSKNISFQSILTRAHERDDWKVMFLMFLLFLGPTKLVGAKNPGELFPGQF